MHISVFDEEGGPAGEHVVDQHSVLGVEQCVELRVWVTKHLQVSEASVYGFQENIRRDEVSKGPAMLGAAHKRETHPGAKRRLHAFLVLLRLFYFHVEQLGILYTTFVVDLINVSNPTAVT
jgi:hypothetical protein